VRKINAAISLQLEREIDNEVENSEEPYKFSRSFFQNSSPFSSLEIGSSSNLAYTIDDVLGDSQKDPPLNSSRDQEDPKENDSLDLSSPKDSSSPLRLKNFMGLQFFTSFPL